MAAVVLGAQQRKGWQRGGMIVPETGDGTGADAGSGSGSGTQLK